jgi:N-methylhydantoinase A/oxoprolinase/acetone carboxylase beta subunit
MSLHAELFLGIDTGGTFTDGVLLEPATRKIIKTAKVLTTHADLRVCISRGAGSTKRNDSWKKLPKET